MTHTGRRSLALASAGLLLTTAAVGAADAEPLHGAAGHSVSAHVVSGTGATPAAASPRITLAFAGDVHFERYVAGLLTKPNSLAKVAPAWSRADFMMLNLETAITTRGTKVAKEYNFRAPSSSLSLLKRAGVDAVSMANNHAADYGTVGLQDTLAAKRSGVLPIVGLGANAAAAYAPLVVNIKGVRVAVLSASQLGDVTAQRFGAGSKKAGIATAGNPARLRAAVRAAAARSDVVVVFLHWGVESTTCASGRQRTLAAQLQADGADVIVGGHAHRYQGSGRLNRAYVAYGLGNHIWYKSAEPSSRTGVLTVSVDANRARAAGIDPRGVVSGASFQPMLISGTGAPAPQSAATTKRLSQAWAASSRCSGLR